ncbi:MAG: lipoyl(octanoyl) transferase LipB [candidate division Zixibacteria bacterium]|nr:lipoyl(octanoyl) transferase LipB [candidate division Zixibacteria bacterium]
MCSSGHVPLYRIELGRTDYKSAWDLQKKLVSLRSRGKIPDCLIITEHDPVVTMGRASSKDNLLISREELQNQGIEFFKIERGGDITFHGPGQIVAYPILDLTNRGRDLHRYLRDLEQIIIETLIEFKIKATTKKGLTGVWVANHKLAAIGVAVSRWISYHGMALNVNTDLDYFNHINPCGITQFPVGSISSILGKKADIEKAVKSLSNNFAKYFGYDMKVLESISDLSEDLAVA